MVPVFAVCPAPFAAFQPTEHVKLATEPVGERSHSDWLFESVHEKRNKSEERHECFHDMAIWNEASEHQLKPSEREWCENGRHSLVYHNNSL